MISFKLISAVLSRVKAGVVHATNGRQAIELCGSSDHFDLVLMDMRMPNMNGYEATKLIKKFRSELPIIAQTAYALYGDDIKAKKAGCDEYITKPVNKKELFELIDKYLK